MRSLLGARGDQPSWLASLALPWAAYASLPVWGSGRESHVAPAPSAAISQSGAPVSSGEATSEALLAGIYHEYSGPIHSYAFHLLGNQEDADDVTQEVFIRAYARLDQLRDPGSLRSWLYRIATNLCMDQMRRRSRIRRVLGLAVSLGPEDDPDAGPARDVAQPAAQAALEGVAERDHIAAALRRMPPKYASCLLMSSVQGLSYHEIATALAISPGAAAVRLSRARDLFARYYDALRDESRDESASKSRKEGTP